tara:strand:+ start:796 stop:1959 length:1164 start_codon:yes stop_codon:yes gene_type:complete
MFSEGIIFKGFNKKKNNSLLKKKLKQILNNKNFVIETFSKNYKYSFNRNTLRKISKFKNFRVIGMGGSILGSQAIYDFFQHKIKKKFEFINNIDSNLRKPKKQKYTNLIISKSGNTIETIANTNILVNKKDKNIIITENKKSNLFSLAEKLKAEVIHHNNFIGGRYSVLSEVGMLPAELMGLKSKNFKQYDELIKNKIFLNKLISNVNSTLYLVKKKKLNSIIINYDKKSENFFNWYQQLVAESLGKKSKGILPIVTLMPKDNHSVMQLFLDGFKNNFFTFFYVQEKKSLKINNKILNGTYNILKNKNLDEIIYAQKKATENIFKKKNIPFRSIELQNRNEETLGKLFTFFILETILLGKALNLNPYDQPAVELIKLETTKILKSKS